MQLDGAVCVLTGAGGGIGRALAQALAGQGARLVLSGRNPDKLEALSSVLPQGSVAEVCAGDLNDPTVQEAISEAARRNGARLLINVCGCNVFGLLEDLSSEEIHELVGTNLVAPIQLTRKLLGYLKSQPEAMIVNVGSTFGSIGFPGYAVYSASKFGLRGFSEALMRELADSRVRVLYVSPRATRTSMNPQSVTEMNETLGNAQDRPERVAAIILRSIAREAKRTGIGWPERFFARLNQLLPAVVDRALSKQLPTIKRFALRQTQS